MTNQVARGKEFEKKADKQLSGWKFKDEANLLFKKVLNACRLGKSCWTETETGHQTKCGKLIFEQCFFLNAKYKDAAKSYEEAAKSYKLGRSWEQAGAMYIKLAECHLKLHRKHDAAGAYAEAVFCYKKTKSKELTMSCLEKVVNLLLKIGNHEEAARYNREISDLHEENQKWEQAIDYCTRAANLCKKAKLTSSLHHCELKIAEFGIPLNRYDRAIRIFEDVAAYLVDDIVLKYGAKDHLLNAGLCRLCIPVEEDQIEALSEIVVHYSDIDRSFKGTCECTLIEALIDAIRKSNVAMWDSAVEAFRSHTQLDSNAEAFSNRTLLGTLLSKAREGYMWRLQRSSPRESPSQDAATLD